jgi:HK97 family phage portal protein
MKILRNKNYNFLKEGYEKAISELQVNFENNELFRGVYGTLPKNFLTDKDSKMQDYINKGYNKNGTVYGLISKIANIFSEIPIVIQKKGELLEEPTNRDEEMLFNLLKTPNKEQGWVEFARLYETFILTTGNGMMYSPRLENGADKGKVNDNGIWMMPPQNTEIESGGWSKPILYYTFNIGDHTQKIEAQDVVHVRFPSMNYENGENFWGVGPVKAAFIAICAANNADLIVDEIYSKPMPPGVMSKENAEDPSAEQISQLKQHYQKQLAKIGKFFSPIFKGGKWQWTKMGYDSVRDLQVIEFKQQFIREVATAMGVQSVLANDTSGTTFSNMKDARKTIIENRVKPDMELLLSEINTKLTPFYGKDLMVVADWSKVPALQEDRKDQSMWITQLVRDGILTRNQALELLGLPQNKDANFDVPTVSLNTIPLDEAILSDEPSEPSKNIKDLGLDNKL